MSFKEFLLDKDVLKADTVKVGKHSIKITELTGEVHSAMLQEDDAKARAFICWNGGTPKGEHLSQDEFDKAWKYRFSMVNDVTIAIGRLSGMFGNIEEEEKN